MQSVIDNNYYIKFYKLLTQTINSHKYSRDIFLHLYFIRKKYYKLTPFNYI